MRRRKLLAWRPVKRRLYFLVAVVWECVSIFSDTAGYNAPRCSLMFAHSCLPSVTTALLTSPGCR